MSSQSRCVQDPIKRQPSSSLPLLLQFYVYYKHVLFQLFNKVLNMPFAQLDICT